MWGKEPQSGEAEKRCRIVSANTLRRKSTNKVQRKTRRGPHTGAVLARSARRPASPKATPRRAGVVSSGGGAADSGTLTCATSLSAHVHVGAMPMKRRLGNTKGNTDTRNRRANRRREHLPGKRTPRNARNAANRDMSTPAPITHPAAILKISIRSSDRPKPAKPPPIKHDQDRIHHRTARLKSRFPCAVSISSSVSTGISFRRITTLGAGDWQAGSGAGGAWGGWPPTPEGLRRAMGGTARRRPVWRRKFQC